MDKIVCTIWVCQCCMLTHANGECCDSDQHGGDGIQPWAELNQGERVTMGGEHAEGCAATDGEDCDCDRDIFSRSQCQGCGSYLHGERHAFTLWEIPRVSLAKAS